jgi:hypothetical protein
MQKRMNKQWLSLAAARVALDLLTLHDLARVGVMALEEGFDSPAIRRLAVVDDRDSEQARSMFDRVLFELEVPMPDKREAAMILARDVAKRIVEATASAIDGANQIWNIALLARNEIGHELDAFVYAASEWNDRPEDRDMISGWILEAAREIVGEDR